MSGTVYTVASGKGGVGKTTTSVNLAVALWQEGNAVALVDADIGMANLAAVLDITPEATLHDVLAGRASVDEALVEAQGGNLLVLPGDRSLESFANADPRELRAAVDELAERCDYVIVDTGAGLSYEDVLPLGMAHGVLLVTTPDPAAFGDTQKTMEVADLLGAPIRGLVVTRAVEDTDAAAIAGEIGAELLGTIPEDPAVMASTVAGNPLESHAPDSAAAGAYRDVAATLLAGDEEWLEAHPREPAPAPVGDAEPVAGPESDDDDGGDDGHETAETVAEAAEVVVDDEETADIGDLLSEPAEDDQSGEEPGPESADVTSPGEAAEPEGIPAAGDEPTDEDADRTEEAADETVASTGPGGVDADEGPVVEDLDIEEEDADLDEDDETGESVQLDEAEGAEPDDEGEGEEVEEYEDEAETTEDETEESADEEEEDEDVDESAGSEDEEDATEVDAEWSEPGDEDEADAEVVDTEWSEPGDEDETDESADPPESEAEEVEGPEEAEPAEPERRGGLLGWLGRLF